MIEDTAVPFPYNVILGRDTALPCPDFGNINNSDTTGFDMTDRLGVWSTGLQLHSFETGISFGARVFISITKLTQVVASLILELFRVAVETSAEF